MNNRSLPSLAALQSFEAAARLGSFTAAAGERCLTHSAISRNIRAVEHWCGQPLFERHGPRVALTEAGWELRARLGDPLQALHEALRQPEAAPARQPLHVLTLPSIASTWLIPRLAVLAEAYPRIALSIETGYDMVSLPPLLPAVAIRFGHFERNGLHCRRLWTDRMVAVASPGWLSIHGGIPSKWPATQLLRHTHEPWPARLPPGPGTSAPGAKLPQAGGFAFNDALLLVEAAVQGAGVAWSRMSLVESLLHSQALTLIGAEPEHADKAAWLVCREDHNHVPQVRAFFSWAIEQSISDAPSG